MVENSAALLVCRPETEHVDFLEHRSGTKGAPLKWTVTCCAARDNHE